MLLYKYKDLVLRRAGKNVKKTINFCCFIITYTKYMYGAAGKFCIHKRFKQQR